METNRKGKKTKEKSPRISNKTKFIKYVWNVRKNSSTLYLRFKSCLYGQVKSTYGNQGKQFGILSRNFYGTKNFILRHLAHTRFGVRFLKASFHRSFWKPYQVFARNFISVLYGSGAFFLINRIAGKHELWWGFQFSEYLCRKNGKIGLRWRELGRCGSENRREHCQWIWLRKYDVYKYSKWGYNVI